MENVKNRTETTLCRPHADPVVNAMTYITCALMCHQVIKEGLIKQLCQRRYPDVTDEMFESALVVLRKGLVITNRKNGFAFSAGTADSTMDLDQLLERFRELSK